MRDGSAIRLLIDARAERVTLVSGPDFAVCADRAAACMGEEQRVDGVVRLTSADLLAVIGALREVDAELRAIRREARLVQQSGYGRIRPYRKRKGAEKGRSGG